MHDGIAAVLAVPYGVSRTDLQVYNAGGQKITPPDIWIGLFLEVPMEKIAAQRMLVVNQELFIAAC